MGLTPGTYLYDWGSDSITLEIETPSSTPTPTPTPTESNLLLFEDGSTATLENNNNIEINKT
jgi:hypothetical protein